MVKFTAGVIEVASRVLCSATLAVVVGVLPIAHAQNAPLLPSFPTVDKLTASIRAESHVMEAEDMSADGPTCTQFSGQLDVLRSERDYLEGSLAVHDHVLGTIEQSLKSPKLTSGGRAVLEAHLTQLKERVDVLHADRELLREQHQMIASAANKVGARALRAGISPYLYCRGDQ